jgi:hypothetical protein
LIAEDQRPGPFHRNEKRKKQADSVPKKIKDWAVEANRMTSAARRNDKLLKDAVMRP